MTVVDLAPEVEALRHGAGAFRASRDVLAVRGADAPTYLQSQLSQDLEGLGAGESADSLLLEPDGKLCALVRVTRTGELEFVLDVEGGFGDAVAARLGRFLLRSKVETERLAWRCLSLRGPRAAAVAQELAGETAGTGLLVVPFEWNGWSGADVLGPADAVPTPEGLPGPVVTCRPAAVEACRIVSGIPAMGAELTNRTIAAEAGLVERTVSFTKGCYTGQELVARIDARGSNVPRRLVGVVAPAEPDASVPSLVPGMTLHAGDPPPGDRAADDKVVGTVTSASWSPELGSWAGLGYLRRSVEAPGPVRVRSGDGTGGSRAVRAGAAAAATVRGTGHRARLTRRHGPARARVPPAAGARVDRWRRWPPLRCYPMPTYLADILAAHRTRAAADRRELGELVERAATLPEPRDFAGALRGDGLGCIAEIKRRSPSKGDLAPGLSPDLVAKEYVAGGAACLSVLTDAEFFGGSPEDLAAARQASGLPVLRKDFTVCEADVADARLMGADAVLLIVAALDDEQLAACAALARRLGLAALVEVHDAGELSRALAAGAGLVGVNQRDLRTFEVDRERARSLAARIPPDVVAVAESGIRDGDDARRLAAVGFDAILVGETLVRAEDRTAQLRALVGHPVGAR